MNFHGLKIFFILSALAGCSSSQKKFAMNEASRSPSAVSDEQIELATLQPAFIQNVEKVEKMYVRNRISGSRDYQLNESQQKAAKAGLDIVPVQWEDTGRTPGSPWGPNISDVSIQVKVGKSDLPQAVDKEQLKAMKAEEKSELFRYALMPAVRKPNMSDETFDLPMYKIKLVVGNQDSGAKKDVVSLTDYLQNIESFLTVSKNPLMQGRIKPLLSPRDTHALISAQLAYLPMGEVGVDFNPVIYNYQSCKEAPAVLVIVATQTGTSAAVISNSNPGPVNAKRQSGQQLFINEQGKACNLRGTAESIASKLQNVNSNENKATAEGMGSSTKLGKLSGSNMVMLIQVPLKARDNGCPQRLESTKSLRSARSMAPPEPENEKAIITAGVCQGPNSFSEVNKELIDTKEFVIERDHRFPVRVTTQFYWATQSGKLEEKELVEFASDLEKIKSDASSFGSLVTSSQERPTSHNVTCGIDEVWPRISEETKKQLAEVNFKGKSFKTKASVAALLLELYGEKWMPFFACVDKGARLNPSLQAWVTYVNFLNKTKTQP